MHQVSVWKSATSQTLHLAQTLPWQWRTQVGDTTTAAYWAALKPTWASKEFPGQQPHLVLLEQLAGEKLFTWCSYVPQRLPERGMNTWNTKLSSRAYTNTLPPLPSHQTALWLFFPRHYNYLKCAISANIPFSVTVPMSPSPILCSSSSTEYL